MDFSKISESVVNEATKETAPVEIQEQPGIDPDVASRLSIIQKKERGVMAREDELKQKLKELEEKQGKLSQWEEYEKLINENPREFFNKKGLSFEQLQQKMLESMQDDELDPIQKAEKGWMNKYKELEDKMQKMLDERIETEKTSMKQQELDQQTGQFKKNLAEFVKNNPEEFELINHYGAAEEVFKVIQDVFEKTSAKGTPKIMDFKEACGLYEKYLEDTVKGVSQLKKVQKLFGVSKDSLEDQAAQMFGQHTIDDSFTASSGYSPDLSTEEGRIKAAAKLFEKQVQQS